MIIICWNTLIFYRASAVLIVLINISSSLNVSRKGFKNIINKQLQHSINEVACLLTLSKNNVCLIHKFHLLCVANVAGPGALIKMNQSS